MRTQCGTWIGGADLYHTQLAALKALQSCSCLLLCRQKCPGRACNSQTEIESNKAQKYVCLLFEDRIGRLRAMRANASKEC
eukprot:scaffold234886_cov20-Tisochrysis_lutea.AAC.2